MLAFLNFTFPILRELIDYFIEKSSCRAVDKLGK